MNEVQQNIALIEGTRRGAEIFIGAVKDTDNLGALEVFRDAVLSGCLVKVTRRRGDPRHFDIEIWEPF